MCIQTLGPLENIPRNVYASRKVGICAILKLSCSKLEFLKLAPIPESPESPTLFQNYSVREVRMLLNVGILHYSHHSAIHLTTAAVI